MRMLFTKLGWASYVVLAVAVGEVVWAGYLLITEGFTGEAVSLSVVGILLLTWGLLAVRSHRLTLRIRRSGIPGTGTITAMRQTGAVENYVNFGVEFEMSVQLSDGRPLYPAKSLEFVPAITLGRLSPGMALPVLADPKGPGRVVIAWGEPTGAPAVGWPAQAPDLSDPGETKAQAAMQELRRKGVPIQQMTAAQLDESLEEDRATLRSIGIGGTALVKGLRDLGTTVGDTHAFDVDLEITADDGRAPYRSSGAAAIPVAVAPRLRKGLRVRVKIHPRNPDVMVFEWDEPVLGA